MITKLRILIAFIGICLSFTMSSLAQSSVIKGYVLNAADSTPVSGAHLIVNGTIRATSGLSDGFFSFTVKRNEKNINISHISFASKRVFIVKDSLLNVYLTPATYELGTFEISSLPYRNIIADKKLYVIDFDFYDNQLLAISLNNRRLRESQLILISENGDTAKATNINKPEYLYKDCFGNHHLIEEKTASQIFQDSLRLLLLYPNNKDIFLNSFASIEGYYNGRFLLRIDRFDNQVIDFYLVDENSQAIFKLTTIADEAGLERLSDKGRLQSMEGYSEHDARFEEMCFYNKKPVLSISENGYIFIFNTVENSIEKYDYHGNFYFQKEIDFAQRSGWEETILYDEKNGTYFTAFSKGGITTIYELYIDEGKLGKSMKIPNLQYVQKLKINNGKAYFLYNDPSNYEYKQLFETPLVFR